MEACYMSELIAMYCNLLDILANLYKVSCISLHNRRKLLLHHVTTARYSCFLKQDFSEDYKVLMGRATSFQGEKCSWLYILYAIQKEPFLLFPP